MQSFRGHLAFSLAIVLSACGSDSDNQDEFAAEVPAETTPAPSESQASAPSDAALTVADLDAYERGVEAEIAAVGEAEGRRAAAASATDSLDALTDATELRTLEVGARAAGLPLDRYRQVRREVDEVLRVNAPSAASQVMGAVDTTDAPPEVRARVRETFQMQEAEAARAREAALASLDPQVAAELQSRVGRLDSLRARLIGERIRVAEGR